MSDKRKYTKNPYAGKKKKVGINQQTRFQTSGRGSLLNLTKVRIITKGHGSMNMNMEKGDYLHLVTIDESSCSGESEAESHNDSVLHDSVS